MMFYYKSQLIKDKLTQFLRFNYLLICCFEDSLINTDKLIQLIIIIIKKFKDSEFESRCILNFFKFFMHNRCFIIM